MFECITELKGLVIDIDSFEENYHEWESLSKTYKCCFLTVSKETKNKLEELYGKESVLLLEKIETLFAPNQSTHEKVLRQLKVLTTEILYVSKKILFATNALGFMSGTVLIKRFPVEYEEASQYPDLVFGTIKELEEALKKDIRGNYGEIVISPNVKNKRGYVMPIEFKCDDNPIQLYSLGRYFGYSHYMNQLHPYSSAIFLNKQEGKKAYGVFDMQFADLYAKVVERVAESNDIECVCHVPVRPGKLNRFKKIVEYVADKTGVEDISDFFVCTVDYESQKGLSSESRAENIKGVFEYKGQLKDKSVILIDDVMSTGATIQECIRVLEKAGAEDVIVVVLAVNQLGGTYWSNSQPIIDCPNCGERMHLLVNSQNKQFFYSCYNCGKTVNYASGKTHLVDIVNNEFEYIDESSENTPL